MSPKTAARILKRRIRLTREGWYYVGVMIFVTTGAMLREINLMLGMAGMMVGPLIFGWRWSIAMLRGLEVQRQAPSGICAGDRLIVELAVRNPRRWFAAWAVTFEDVLRREDPTEDERLSGHAVLGRLAAGQLQRLTYHGVLTRRGRYLLGPIRMSTRFPFGLTQRSIVFEQPRTLLVYPRLGRLRGEWSRMRHESVTGSSRRQSRRSLSEGEFYGLRDWRQGDNQRWVHWRSSARRGSLIVRQFEQPSVQDFVVLVELWQPESPTEADRQRVEMAVSLAATMIADICRQGGSQLSFGLAGEQVFFSQAAASVALLEDLLQQLAVAQATSQLRLADLTRDAADQLRYRTRGVLVTTREERPHVRSPDEEPRAEDLTAHLRTVSVASPAVVEIFELD